MFCLCELYQSELPFMKDMVMAFTVQQTLKLYDWLHKGMYCKSENST